MSSRRKVKRQRRRLPKSIYGTPRYQRWRAKVFKRDTHICRLCGKSKCFLEAHHVKRKAVYPHLTYRTNNGVTLCKPCHNFVTGQEGKFVTLFNHILKGSLSNKFIFNWRDNFNPNQKRWMQRRGIIRHLDNNNGQLPTKAGMIIMDNRGVQKGSKRIRMWKRKPYER